MENKMYDTKTETIVEPIAYFDEPTQVCYKDVYYEPSDDEDYYDIPVLFGIAYCGEIICGCCGGITDIAELFRNADEMDFDLSFNIFPWLDISDDLRDDDFDYPEKAE